LNNKTLPNGIRWFALAAVLPVILPFMVVFAGFIVLAQDSDILSAGLFYERSRDFSSGWVRPARWYRSNAGGMALEEIHSRTVALRNEYALAVIYAHHSEIPDFLTQFYNEDYLPEIRILYRNGEQTRTQWILRDSSGKTRLNAVFTEPGAASLQIAELNVNESFNYTYNDNVTGFIEIFDRDSLLITEHRLYENGRKNRINYEFNNNLLISAVVSSQENNSEYRELYADYYRYNRYLSLRAVERVFFSALETDEPVFISFPRRAMDAVRDFDLGAQRINLYPEFFGDGLNEGGSRIVYETDERGRILSETFYNENEEIVWIVRNTWANNRIVFSVKIEDDTELLAEYEYDSGGNKTLERNYKNGIIERVVSVEGNTEIEELYLNNAVVLRAVWEDGRKISETRMR